MTNSISAFYAASMQPPQPTTTNTNTTNATTISEQDFLARVEAFERNEEREARRAIALMKRLVAQDSRSNNVTPAGALSNSTVRAAVTQSQSRQPPPVPQVPSLSSSAHSSPPPTTKLATSTCLDRSKRQSSITTRTSSSSGSSNSTFCYSSARHPSTGPLPLLDAHANLSVGPSTSTHIHHATTLTNPSRPTSSSINKPSSLMHDVIHLTRGPKDKDAIRFSTTSSNTSCSISSSSNSPSTSPSSFSCDHKAQGAGPRVPSSTITRLPDALRTISPDSSSSTEYAHPHLRLGPSSSSSYSSSSALSSSALRPSDLGTREKSANKTITSRGENSWDNGSTASRATDADSQRGTQRHPHVHRTTSSSSRATSPNHPIVPLARQREYCRPASSSTATPPSRLSSPIFSSQVPVVAVASTDEDRSRPSLQRTRRNSTVTLEYNVKTDSSLQTYRQRTDSRASLAPTAAAMNVKKKPAVVASATSSSTKDRIYSKPAFNPPQRVKLVSPLYA